VTEALRHLGALATEPLIAALYSEERRAAVEELGRLGDPRAVEPLIAVLHEAYHAAPSIQEAAAEALGRLGDPRALDPIIATQDAANSGDGWAAE
jgi:HEAT repeat protein